MSRVQTYGGSGFIPGPLPQLPRAAPIGGSPAGIQQDYQTAYDTALGANQALYNNVLSGYQDVAAGQRTAQNALAGGYAGMAGRIRDQSAAAAGGQAAVAGFYGDTLGDLYGRQSYLDGRYAGLGREVQGALDPMGQAAGRFGGRNAQLAGEYGVLDGQVRERLIGHYNNVRAGQQAGAADVRAGYGRLNDSVMGDIRSVGESERMDLDAAYAQRAGAARQSLTSRGLNNTTVRDSVERGLEFDRRRAGIDLADRQATRRAEFGSRLGLAAQDYAGRAVQDEAMIHARGSDQVAAYGAQLGLARLGFAGQANRDELQQANLEAQSRAGYAAQIGQAELGYRERAGNVQAEQANRQTAARLGVLGDQAQRDYGAATQFGLSGLAAQDRGIDRNTGLAQRQLDFMGSVQAPYPDAGQYAQLAQQAALAQELGRRGGFQTVGGPGGVTTTRGAPWNPGGGMSGGGGGFGGTGWGGPDYSRIAAAGGIVTGGVRDAFGNGTTGGAAFPGGAFLTTGQLSGSPYAPPPTGFGGGSRGGAAPAPAQFDAGGGEAAAGGTAGYGFRPADDFYGNLSQSGFGGGFGGQAAPAQFSGAGGFAAPGALSASPYAPPQSGFGGGTGGGLGGGALMDAEGYARDLEM